MEEFKVYNSDLSQKTQKAHLNNYNKIVNNIGDIDVSQDYFLKSEFYNNQNNSQKLQLLNTFSKYLQMNKRSNDKVVNEIKNVNNEMKKGYKERNKEKKYDYSLKDLKKMLNNYYNKGEWKKFIATYMVLTFNTRTKDLDVVITKNKKLIKDFPDNNYLLVLKGQVKYVRRIYKTQSTYGDKTHNIKSKKFMNAVNEYLGDRETRTIINSSANINRELKKLLPYGLTTADILKITLGEKNSLNQASKIGKNRGTDISTLQDSYNIIV